MYQMFTLHFAVYYDVIYIEKKKIIKIFEEQFAHSIQEYAWCMSNAVTDILPLEFSVCANESCFRPRVWVNRNKMIPSLYV